MAGSRRQLTLRIGPEVLDAVEVFLTDRGADGLEAAGLVGFRACAGGGWMAETFIAPDQVADNTGLGCWVQVTERGKRELAARLPAGCRYLARIHSHPGRAFHSSTDDANPALTHDGAISIVVPYFGLGLRRGLGACAIFRLTAGRWMPARARRDGDDWVIGND
jgi:hypothetical protein